MAVNTILLDFTVKWAHAQNDGFESKLVNVLEKYISQLKKVAEVPMDDGGTMLIFQGIRGSTTTVRTFSQGLLTLSIDYYKEDSEEPLLSFQTVAQLEDDISENLACLKAHRIPPMKRGKFNQYLPTSDERILEYDIDVMVFDEKSKYQKVQIMHSKTFGNMLVLDGLQNLSEKDLVYTETLMQRGKENYEGKEIVILGGGDGALLYELLKEKPKNVLMLELDDVVIRACREHMRSCCGDVLDQLKGPNYEIILDDCMKSMNEMIKEGRQVDYVFGDLTDVPVSTNGSTQREEEVWDFIKLILNTSLKILKPDGKFMTHCCGTSCPSGLVMYEDVLSQLDEKVTFTKDTAFVPSFLEYWVFYQISKQL